MSTRISDRRPAGQGQSRQDGGGKPDLDRLFGKATYALASDPQSLERTVQGIRVGHEIFPWLMVLILILVTAENLLANRFHRETPKGPAVGVGLPSA